MDDVLALMILILGIGVAFWAIYWGHRTKRLQYEERRLMIEKGMEPPPALVDEPKKRVTPEDCLRRGVIMLFLGIGLAIAYLVLRASAGDGPPPWLFGTGGAIVGLLGGGNLVYYAIAKRHRSGPVNDSAVER